jgi:hypothetical protein
LSNKEMGYNSVFSEIRRLLLLGCGAAHIVEFTPLANASLGGALSRDGGMEEQGG